MKSRELMIVVGVWKCEWVWVCARRWSGCEWYVLMWYELWSVVWISGRFYSVMVSTPDFESCIPGSNPGRTYLFPSLHSKPFAVLWATPIFFLVTHAHVYSHFSWILPQSNVSSTAHPWNHTFEPPFCAQDMHPHKYDSQERVQGILYTPSHVSSLLGAISFCLLSQSIAWSEGVHFIQRVPKNQTQVSAHSGYNAIHHTVRHK